MMDNDIIAYLKLRIITAALNEGWEPQYTEGEYRYYPFFALLSKAEYDRLDDDDKERCAVLTGRHAYAGGGLVCLSLSDQYSGYGACFAYKTRELAKYSSKQFFNIWADFVYKVVDHTNQHE